MSSKIPLLVRVLLSRIELFLCQLRLKLSRLPDASVSLEQVASDIASIASVGAGGLEFLPFYLYGLPTSIQSQTPTDWNKYGFGSAAFQSLFKGALHTVNKSDILMDFGVGANQGQGVPANPLTEGLAVQLVCHLISPCLLMRSEKELSFIAYGEHHSSVWRTLHRCRSPTVGANGGDYEWSWVYAPS